jgi:hypothetical protein
MIMKRAMKFKKTIMAIKIILVLVVLQTLPVFFVKPWNSKEMKNDFINLSYQEGDEEGAREVFNLLVEKSESIYDKMDYVREDPIDVIIYKTQSSLAIREAGFITLLIAPDWYIGDSHNGNVMMLSPNTPIEAHTHDSILMATIHELVHSINYRINPNLSYFWDNGLATYLSKQVPGSDEYDINRIPSIEDMHTDNGLKFGNMGGYAFSYLYIQYLDETYGWDKVVAYSSGDGNYKDVFNKTEEDIYNEWCLYLKSMNNETIYQIDNR